MNRKTQRTLDGLLIAGIALRLLVLLTASPFIRDGHFDVIRYVASHAALPASNQLEESYQPPLYYLLMAPVFRLWPGPLPIHCCSFVISVANLLLIRWLMNNPLVISHNADCPLAFALLCFSPQIVMFGSFISNDTLAMFVGTVVFAAAVRYVERPQLGTRSTLALTVGLSLLTKGSLLLAGPAMALIVANTERRRGWRRATTAALGFCLIWVAVGCFKYVDNYVRFRNPVINALDVDSPFKRDQSGTWKGWKTVYDVNILKLIRHPVLQPNNTFSYPLLMYGTFWYAHIPDETSFDGNVRGLQWVGSAIYAVAVVPTLVFLIGAGRAILMARSQIQGRVSPDLERKHLVASIALAILLSNAVVVVAAGVKYDVWSSFEARLCFPSLAAAIVIFGLGMEGRALFKWVIRSAEILGWATVAASVLYFFVEVPLACGFLPAGLSFPY